MDAFRDAQDQLSDLIQPALNAWWRHWLERGLNENDLGDCLSMIRLEVERQIEVEAKAD
jgi:hypothetical protein